MSPLEPRAQQLWHNLPALMFMDFWQIRSQRAGLRELARMLGVLWLREDIEQNESSVEAAMVARNELRVPLACAIEPGIMDVVKQYFGKRGGIDPPEWTRAQKGELVELFSTSREDFLKFVRGHVSPKVT